MKGLLRWLVPACCLSVLSVLSMAGTTAAGDWVHWRGPEQTGVSREKNLPDKFGIDPSRPNSNLVWKQPYGGRSTPLVLNGRVYLINGVGEGLHEQERVMCLDADTGKVLWEHKFNVFHTDIVSNRVGWTNLAGDAETGNIYAHGVQGLLFCFNKDGKILWSHSLTEEYGRITGYGGRVTSPTVDGDLVIIGMVNASWGEQARGGNRFLALDKRTGTPIWWTEVPVAAPATYYSTPVVAVIHGERLFITGACDGSVHALKVRTGERVWGIRVGARAINNSPVVDGNLVYVSHGEENLDTNVQGRVVCLDASQVTDGKPKVVWQEDGIRAGFASPILHEGRLYACDDKANMYCLDARTGKTLWKYKYGKTARGSPIWADGKIYIAEVASRFYILKPGDKRCEELHSQFFRSPDGLQVVELNGSPSVANGRIYFNTRDEMYCIGKKDWKPEPVSIPSGPEESAADKNAKVAHLQIVPADVALEPGESVTFTLRGFDAQGRFLREVKGQLELAAALPPPAPPAAPGAPGAGAPVASVAKPAAAAPAAAPPVLQGELSPTGQLTVSKTLPAQFGRVVAKAEGLSAYARVRVAPRLPYTQDFEKVPEGRTPPGWINAQGKFVVVTRDGSKVLKKLADNMNPLLARANAYIGMPGLTGYTIQCDLLGGQKGNDLPDMGLVANRYSLVLDGNKQQLRISSWEALPRVDKVISWPWKSNTWYRTKLTVEVAGDKAIVRGKVWPRDQQEPADWTIDFEDPVPNREGSPAIYGYATGILENATGAEIFYDNLSIVPHRKAAARGAGSE